MRVQIEAPAKLNLHLSVRDKRPDGFHNIESLFCALAFGDTLHVETVPIQDSAPQICMDWQFAPPPSLPPLPIEKNIISKAVSLFRRRTGFDAGLKITVEKRIPLGGGLGGGSSNAAATLLALNRLAPEGGIPPVSDRDLAEMGASLGSDVPFFLSGASAAWVTGRGERIQPLELPESARNLSILLVFPFFSSSTAEAFSRLDDKRAEYSPAPPQNCEFLRESFAKPPRDWPFENDFLPVFADHEGKGPVYQQILSRLRECGADFAGLSGSGSTCFGVFGGAEKAESAKKILLGYQPFVINTFFTCVTGDTIVQ